MRASGALAALRVAGLFVWSAWVVLRHLPTVLPGRGVPPAISLKWHRTAARIAGLDVRVHGRPVSDRAVLYAANHASYFDIVALGATLPCAFVSKAEVNDWPIFGWLARQQRTVFIDRAARRASVHLEAVRERLEAGDHLVVFPEGTSTDGQRVLPFKSSLFEAARAASHERGAREGETVAVQPVSIAYSRLDGVPMGRAFRPLVTWYGDMDLGPHLWTALGLGRIGIDVVLHPPVRLSDFDSRKALAEHCHAAVAAGLRNALAGRPDAGGGDGAASAGGTGSGDPGRPEGPEGSDTLDGGDVTAPMTGESAPARA